MVESAFPPVAAIILAAGESTRMGRPKLLLIHQSVPLLRRAVDAAVGGGCQEVVVVLGADRDRYEAQLTGSPARVAYNPDYHEGMSSSLRVGIEALSPDVQAAVIMLADQPFIDAAIIRKLLERYQTSGMRIVTCQYGSVRGVPTLFDRALFLELLILEGDQGARQVMEAYPRHVTAIEIPPEAARDVDRPEDLSILE